MTFSMVKALRKESFPFLERILMFLRAFLKIGGLTFLFEKRKGGGERKRKEKKGRKERK